MQEINNEAQSEVLYLMDMMLTDFYLSKIEFWLLLGHIWLADNVSSACGFNETK